MNEWVTAIETVDESLKTVPWLCLEIFLWWNRAKTANMVSESLDINLLIIEVLYQINRT